MDTINRGEGKYIEIMNTRILDLFLIEHIDPKVDWDIRPDEMDIIYDIMECMVSFIKNDIHFMERRI